MNMDNLSLTRAFTIDFLLSFDEKWICHGASAIASVIYSLHRDVKARFHCLDAGLDCSSIRTLEKWVTSAGHSVHFYPIPDQSVEPFQSMSRASLSQKARLCAAELLPHLDTVIYLDADMVAVRPLDFNSLLSNESDAILQGAPDIKHFGTQKDDGTFLPDAQTKLRLGLTPCSFYFNSGFLVMNLKRWREHSLTSRLAAWLPDNNHLATTFDQDVFNAVLHPSEKGSLSVSWNWIPYQVAITRHLMQPPPESPRILHYASRGKPWKHPLLGVSGSYFYWLARSRTPWGSNKTRLFALWNLCLGRSKIP
jgi:lipopolysaccharide biosynthesis glycosyltransferase